MPALPYARRFFVPEVVQTSEMDCGPAALKALLEGFGVRTSYGRLREACQTSVDGTNIDTLEQIAVQLGLNAQQIMLPSDHLLLDETHALPALIVVRLPNGLTHFIVAWNRVGSFVQIMDPGTGRRWITQRRLRDELFIHTLPVDANAWRAWAGSDGFLNPLRRRMRDVRVPEASCEKWIAHACDAGEWFPLAALDATVRMTTALVQARALETGSEATRVIGQFFHNALRDPGSVKIPNNFWSVSPFDENDADRAPQLLLVGAVLVRITGRRVPTATGDADESAPPLPPELAAVLQDTGAHPERAVFDALRRDGLLTPTVLLVGLALATFGVMVQALLFQALLQITTLFKDYNQRLAVLGALFLFIVLLFILEIPISQIVQRIGRRLETRLRVRFLEKIPRLGDRYFHSRLTSDMVQRAYSLRQLHLLPTVGVNLIRLTFQLILTTLGVIWLDPHSLPLALAATTTFLLMAWLTNPLLQERDLRVRSQVGALSRFYLDALLGLIPLRVHGAQRAFRREYEGLLTEWVRASSDLARVSNYLQAVSAFLYSVFAVWLVSDYVARHGASSNMLLLFFWTLNLPMLATSVVQSARQYPMLRNLILRMLEPLGAPDEETLAAESTNGAQASTPNVLTQTKTCGVALELKHVSIVAGGHTILSDLDFTIQPGEHVAIVGPSGAGKSSLVGILLGWHKPASGECRVDDTLLSGARLKQLRRETVWVDPAVQLWNRTLWDNVLYGNTPDHVASPERAIQDADLERVLERLDRGMQTVLGEGGGLVSGGEGQRVRLGRAMARAGTRLVILDEPFRGLDRETRRKLLKRAREYWRDATLLCITHDVGETMPFERVLVIENGRVVQDDAPDVLAENPASRYRQLLDSEEMVRRTLWQGDAWKKMWIENGKLQGAPEKK